MNVRRTLAPQCVRHATQRPREGHVSPALETDGTALSRGHRLSLD
jgi:hypothetical protein